MKKFGILVSLVVGSMLFAMANMAFAEDPQQKGVNNIDKFDPPPVQGGQSIDQLGKPPNVVLPNQGSPPVIDPPKGGTTVKVDNKVFNSVSTGKRDYYTVPEIESHIRKGVHPKKCGTNVNLRPSRATTARKSTVPRKGKEGTMPNPNITIHNHIPPTTGVSYSATVPKNPNIDGVAKFDPNMFPDGNGGFTVSIGADGSAYMHRDSSGVNLGWLWVLLGILAILAIVAMFRGGNGGGGGNHYHNYPAQPVAPVPPAPQPVAPQPAPAAPPAQPAPATAPAAPAAPPQGGGQPAPPFAGGNGGHAGAYAAGPVVVLMTPTGSPQQHQQPKSDPVVVNVHNHYPTTSAAPKAEETKKPTAKKPSAEAGK